jgi:hypothetical protein
LSSIDDRHRQHVMHGRDLAVNDLHAGLGPDGGPEWLMTWIGDLFAAPIMHRGPQPFAQQFAAAGVGGAAGSRGRWPSSAGRVWAWSRRLDVS